MMEVGERVREYQGIWDIWGLCHWYWQRTAIARPPFSRARSLGEEAASVGAHRCQLGPRGVIL